MGVFDLMPVFFHKKEPKTIRAYSLEHCPNPEEWTSEKPDYSLSTKETVKEAE
jgi:hypothetical protein